MLITYRRTGGVLALLAVVAVAVAGLLLAATAVAALAVVAVALAGIALVARMLAWTPWRRRAAAPTVITGDTIEGTVVSSVPSEAAKK